MWRRLSSTSIYLMFVSKLAPELPEKKDLIDAHGIVKYIYMIPSANMKALMCEYASMILMTYRIKCFSSFRNCLVCMSFFIAVIQSLFYIIHSFLLAFSTFFCVNVFKTRNLAHYCSSSTVCNVILCSSSTCTNSLAIFRVKLWDSWVLNSYSCQHRRSWAFRRDPISKHHTDPIHSVLSTILFHIYSASHNILSHICTQACCALRNSR